MAKQITNRNELTEIEIDLITEWFDVGFISEISISEINFWLWHNEEMLAIGEEQDAWEKAQYCPTYD